MLVRVRINFHERYGLSLLVEDIDPSYTLGDMVRRRKEIIDKLTAEGVVNLNKQLVLPRLLLRIAVITSETAAGFGDFFPATDFREEKIIHLGGNDGKFNSLS